MSTTKVIFIAGPIRADNAWDREQNIRRAEGLALQVWRLGCAAICVHSAGRFYDENEARENGWLERDLEILRRCDAVLLVGGWEKSAGTRGEIEEAKRLGKKVFVYLEALELWLASGTAHEVALA